MSDLTVWHFLFALCVIPAAVGFVRVLAKIDARRSPGDRALDTYEAQP